MTKEDAVAWAIQCWTTPQGELLNGPDVTNAFADMLVKRVAEAVGAAKLREARQVFADAFSADPHFRYGYVANVAMKIVDRIGSEYIQHAEANHVADEIVSMLFEAP